MAKVMVVDDAAFMRRILGGILSGAGHEVVECEDGQEAVKRYPQVRPDLVTMDITMPEMDGLEACRRILASDPEARIVMCSALGQEEIVREAIRIGAREFIVKPFAPERILQAVQGVLQ
jgi:two-component system, chemotaxis family, chemotaxis protein CheY